MGVLGRVVGLAMPYRWGRDLYAEISWKVLPETTPVWVRNQSLAEGSVDGVCVLMVMSLQPRTPPSQIVLWSCKGPSKIPQTALYRGRGLGVFFSFSISRWMQAAPEEGKNPAQGSFPRTSQWWGSGSSGWHTHRLWLQFPVCVAQILLVYIKSTNLGTTLLGFWLGEN